MKRHVLISSCENLNPMHARPPPKNVILNSDRHVRRSAYAHPPADEANADSQMRVDPGNMSLCDGLR